VHSAKLQELKGERVISKCDAQENVLRARITSEKVLISPPSKGGESVRGCVPVGDVSCPQDLDILGAVDSTEHRAKSQAQLWNAAHVSLVFALGFYTQVSRRAASSASKAPGTKVRKPALHPPLTPQSRLQRHRDGSIRNPWFSRTLPWPNEGRFSQVVCAKIVLRAKTTVGLMGPPF
jgi:hypothetical protein